MPPVPKYPLEDVQRLVGLDQLIVSRTALTRAEELGYDREELLNCLKSIEKADFYKVWENEDKNITFDVYKFRYSPSNNPDIDDFIYAKIRIRNHQLCIAVDSEESVILGSFKLA